MSEQEQDPFDRAVEIAERLLSAPSEFVMPDPDRLGERSLDAYLARPGLNIEIRRRLAAGIREGRLPRTQRLRELIAAKVTDEIPAPARRRGRPSKQRWTPDSEITPEQLWRSTIRGAVQVILDDDLLDLQRSKGAVARRSACDAVSVASERVGRFVSYDQVLDAYQA